MNRLKKYLTIMLLLGLTCPATACNSSSSSEDEVPPHLKPAPPRRNRVGTTTPRPTARRVW